MVLGFKVEFRGFADPLDLEVVLVFLAPRRFGVGHVGDFSSLDRQAPVKLGQAGFGLGDFVLEELALLDFGRPDFWIEFAFHGKGVFVPLFAQFLHFPLKFRFLRNSSTSR